MLFKNHLVYILYLISITHLLYFRKEHCSVHLYYALFAKKEFMLTKLSNP